MSLWNLHRTCRPDIHRIWELGHHTLPMPISWDGTPMEILPSSWRIYVEATSMTTLTSLEHHSWEGLRYSHRRTCLHRPLWPPHVLSAPQVPQTISPTPRVTLTQISVERGPVLVGVVRCVPCMSLDIVVEVE